MEKNGSQHAWLGAVKTTGVNMTNLAGACVPTRGSRELMHGDLKGQLELSQHWLEKHGMAVGELKKMKRKRENGPLYWALVWAITLGLSLG